MHPSSDAPGCASSRLTTASPVPLSVRCTVPATNRLAALVCGAENAARVTPTPPPAIAAAASSASTRVRQSPIGAHRLDDERDLDRRALVSGGAGPQPDRDAEGAAL